MEPYVHIPDVLLQGEYIASIINVELYTCDILSNEYIMTIIPSIILPQFLNVTSHNITTSIMI